MSRVLYPGSFDPFTCGHADIVERALSLFDEITIGIGHNAQKLGWIPIDERVKALQRYYKTDARIQIEAYSNLTADFAAERGCNAIVRGIRSVKDYEYELQAAEINRQLTGIETILLPSTPNLSSVSSSLVRELLQFGHDITHYLPDGLDYSLPKDRLIH